MTGLDVRWALRLPASGALAACNCWGGDEELVHDGVTYTAGTLTGPATLAESLGVRAQPLGFRVGSTPAIKSRLRQDPGLDPVKLLMLWRPSGGTGSWTEARRIEGSISRVELAGTELAVEIDPEVPKPAAQAPAAWSDRSQRAQHGGDRFFEHLGRLSRGVPVEWPS